MKSKRNSGMSIVEIIISLSIISLVLILMFSLLMHVRYEDTSNNVQSSFVINQSSFIKAIEEDIVSYGVKSISPCTLADANITTSVVAGYENKYKCLRIDYAADYILDKTGFIFIFNYYTKYEKVDGVYRGTDSAWMVQYVRGSYTKCNHGQEPTRSSWKNKTTLMREMPDQIDLDLVPYVNYTALQDQTNAASLVIPVVTLDGVHYDFNLSFTFKGNENFKCDNFDNKKLSCNCRSSNALCEKTYDYSNLCS